MLVLALLLVTPVGQAAVVSPQQMAEQIIDTDWGRKLPDYQRFATIVAHIPYLDGERYYYSYNNLPICVVPTDDGLMLSISNLLPDILYNSLQFSLREAAADEVGNIMIPFVTQISVYAEQNNIKLIAVGAHLRLKDFTNKYNSVDNNWLLVVFPVPALTEYVNGLITDQDLVNKSNVFVKVDESTGFRRIAVNLK